MLYRLVVLLATTHAVLALSSHSPVDLEAFPAYSVSFLSEHPVLNETALELLAEQAQDTPPPHSLPPKRHLLRTPSGQAFLCSVPSVTVAEKKRAQRQAELDESTRQLERRKGLERGLALLEPMRGGCIYLKQNWFTYSFCYGSEIRQFHAVQVAGSPIPKEDPNSEAYILGHSPEPTVYSSNPKYGSGSLQLAKKEAMIPSALGGSEGLGLDESGRYLVQVWEGGSTCDKTGLPRTVEVQFHCNTQTIDRIALIRETSICRYVLLIHTPRLCAEPLFLEGADKSSEPASVIECQPIVSRLPTPDLKQVISIGDTNSQGGSSEDESLKTEEPDVNVDAPPVLDESVFGDHVASTVDVDKAPGDTSGHPGETDYVDATLTLVYNPETGEIESVETSIEDGSGDATPDELRRRVTEGGIQGADQKHQDENDRERERRDPVSIDRLEDMVRLMTESLAEAIKSSSDQRTARGREEVELRSPSPPTKPDTDEAKLHKQQLDVMSLLKEVWGVDASTTGTLSQEQLDRMSKVQQRFQEQQNRKRKSLVEPPKNEAFEEMREGFGRKYELVGDDEAGQEHTRDEL